MADLAEISDVEDSWRTLAGAEVTVASSELSAASADIRLALDDIDARIAAEIAAGGLTPLGDRTRLTVARAVRRYLKARDPRDPTLYSGPLVTKDEIAQLAASYDSEPTVPVGAFPALVDYPVY